MTTMRVCSADGCELQNYSRNYCRAHAWRLKTWGDPRVDIPIRKKPNASGGVCSVDTCKRRHFAQGLCAPHYQRLVKHGDVMADEPIAAKGSPSETGKSLDAKGYVVVRKPGHPNAKRNNGWILEHRLVMSDHLERPLREKENVHHINGDKTDNRIENLELWTTSQPTGQRVEDKVAWAVDFLQIYAPGALSS